MTETGCPFCIDNGMLDVLEPFDNSILVRAKRTSEETQMMEVIEGAFLLITHEHIPCGETVDFNFYNEMLDAANWLVWNVYGVIDNLSLNLTERGGMRIDHTHAWLVNREKLEQWLREVYGITNITIENVGLVTLLEELIKKRDELRTAYCDNGDARAQDIS